MYFHRVSIKQALGGNRPLCGPESFSHLCGFVTMVTEWTYR